MTANLPDPSTIVDVCFPADLQQQSLRHGADRSSIFIETVKVSLASVFVSVGLQHENPVL